MGWLSKLFNLDITSKKKEVSREESQDSKSDACNRLKLVLMHDRTKLSPDVLAQMRDELVSVISRYVEIDEEALELNLERESNTIALVANIPMRGRTSGAGTATTRPASVASTPSAPTESTPASNPTPASEASNTNNNEANESQPHIAETPAPEEIPQTVSHS